MDRISDVEDDQPVLELNTSDDYNKLRKWKQDILQEPGCRGRIKRAGVYTWEILHGLEPVWQIIIISGTATGVQFASTLAQQDVERALVMGLFSGILMGLVLLMIWKISFNYGAFVDRRYARYFRNEWHSSAFVTYVLYVVMAALVISGIFMIDRYCGKGDGESPCDIKHVFIGK